MAITSKFKVLPEVSDLKWANFSAAIECPSCGDTAGHAGIFPLDEDDEEAVVSAFCVKCQESFFEADSVAKFNQTKTYSRKTNEFWEVDYETRSLSGLHKTLGSLLGLLQLDTPNWEEKTIAALKQRNYPSDFISYLMSEGVMWYEPTTKPVVLYGADLRAPMLQDTGNGKDGLFVPLRGCRGLLLPAYRHGKLIGLSLRNMLNEGQEGVHRYMGFKTVNTGASKKTGKNTDSHAKYLPTCTILDHNTNQSPLLSAPEMQGHAVFITEGELKAMAVHYFFKEVTIGVRGVADFTSRDVKKFVMDNRHKTFIVCPDRDYVSNRAVSRSLYKLIQFLEGVDVKVVILNWKHGKADIDANLKGIDDAILYDKEFGGVVFSRLSTRQFFAKMHPSVRKEVAQGLVKPGMVFTENVLDTMDFVLKDDTNFFVSPDIAYDRSAGPELYAELASKHKLIVDISPTGTGKSHRAGLCTVELFQEYFDREAARKHKELRVQNQLSFDFLTKDTVSDEVAKALEEARPRRIKVIEQSPMNNSVATMKTDNWQVVTGRTASGWTFDPKTRKYRHALPGETLVIPANCPQSDDIVKLRKNRQVTEVRKDICSKCPAGLDGSCKYWADKKKTKTSQYTRMSSASFNARQGDVVFCDDWGSLEHFIEFEFTRADVDKLVYLLNNKAQWKYIASSVMSFIEQVLGKMKLGQRGREVFSDMLDADLYGLYPIDSWLQLPEPDAVSKQFIKVHGSGIEIDDGAVELNDVKRFLFLFLQVFTGKSIGDLFYKGQKDGQDVWIVKGVDPKYKDMLSTVSSFVIFDATANPAELEKIFGEKPLIIGATADPLKNINIKVVKGMGNTYKSYMWKDRSKKAYMQKFNYILNYMKEHPEEKVGVLTYKELVVNEEVRALFGPDVTWGYWWNDDRASNVYYQNGVTTLFTIGVPIPNIASAAAEVDAVTGAKDFIYVARPYGERKDGGNQDYIITRDSEDEVVRSNVWYKRSAAFIQAIGRLRSVQQPDKQFNFVVMDDIALPFYVNEIETVDPNTEIIVNTAENEQNLKVKYLSHLVTMFEAAVEAGHKGMSEATRAFLQEWGYEFTYMDRYAPELRTFFTLGDMIKLLKTKIEEAKVLPVSYIPVLLQAVRQTSGEIEGELVDLHKPSRR